VTILVVSAFVSGIIAMDPNLLDHNLESHGVLMDRAGLNLSGLISLIGPIDRNLHNWWLEYTTSWNDYNTRLHSHDNDTDEFYCPQHQKLLTELGTLKTKTDLVKDGIEDKLEQLNKIKNVLEDPNVIGATGFHCRPVGTTWSNINLTQANMPESTLVVIQALCDSVTNLTASAENEMAKIKTEIKQIEIEIKYIEEYVCDCLYYEWDDNHLDLKRTLDSCTKPCGNGTQTETRGKRWEKKNNGEECDVKDSKRVNKCNSECCSKACHWNAWGDWGDCSDSCSADTEQCRERTQNITDTCPTMPDKWNCDGDSKETITTCSNIKGKKDRIEELENEIERLKSTHENEIGTCKSKVNDLRQTMCPLGCLNGGECTGVGHCTCQLGFTGSRCDQPYEVACSSGAMCKSEYCQANNLTQTPDTKWKQPWCDLSGRCLTTQESGPGHDRCNNNIGYKFLNGDDTLTTNWCQNDKMETLCPFPIVTTTTTTTTPAPTTTTTTTTATPITYDIIEGGCYEDRIPPNSHRERMLTGNYGYLENNTLMACKEFCQGFNYFGVQDTYDCFCGNIIHHLNNVAASECNALCPGNSNQKCGGPYRQNLYSMNANIGFTAEPSSDGLLAWLKADTDYVDVTGTSVNSVTCGIGSTIQKFGTVKFTVDSIGGAKKGYYEVGPGNDCFQMDAVQTPGVHTVFLVFKTTHNRGPIAGADPGGYGHFDTEVGFGAMNNHFTSPTPSNGEFVMSTHYSGGVNQGVASAGKTFNDGMWHWVEIYGGTNPSGSGNLYSLRFDTGDYYEKTDVNDGWMRQGVGFYIGRGQGTFGGTAYVKDVLVYNRTVTEAERTVITASLDVLIGKAPPTTTTTTTTPSTTGPPHIDSSGSGVEFEIRNLTIGRKVWTDRSYTFSALPEEVLGGVLFSGPHRIPQGSVITLNGGQDGTLYAFLSHGRSGTYLDTLPQAGWQNTNLTATWSGHYEMDVYKISSSSTILPMSQGEAVVAFGFVATTH